jgi:hypothetical protein
MPGARAINSIVAFLRGFLARDRYLTEALAAVVTFGVGVLASISLEELQTRPSLSGFRDMPYPELWMMAFAIPGVICAGRLWREGETYEGTVSLAVMLSFPTLGAVSLLIDLSNWGFWTLFALQLGVLKGYAIVREWTYLRWGVAVLGAFFWVNLTLSISDSTPGALPLLLSPCAGFAAANLLSVSRLSGRRGHA